MLCLSSYLSRYLVIQKISVVTILFHTHICYENLRTIRDSCVWYVFVSVKDYNNCSDEVFSQCWLCFHMIKMILDRRSCRSLRSLLIVSSALRQSSSISFFRWHITPQVVETDNFVFMQNYPDSRAIFLIWNFPSSRTLFCHLFVKNLKVTSLRDASLIDNYLFNVRESFQILLSYRSIKKKTTDDVTLRFFTRSVIWSIYIVFETSRASCSTRSTSAL